MYYLLELVRHARACLTFFKCQYFREGWELFYLLHVVTNLRKLHCYHVNLVGYGPACPKFSEITNYQYLWEELTDFVNFWNVVICILLDIHWIRYPSYKNMLYKKKFSISDCQCFKLKKLENSIEVSSSFFASIEATKIFYFGLWPQNILGQSVCTIFDFWHAWLINLNTGSLLLHCTCFVYFCFFFVLLLFLRVFVHAF